MSKKTLRILLALQLFLVLLVGNAVLSFFAYIKEWEGIIVITDYIFLAGNVIGLGLSIYIWRSPLETRPKHLFKLLGVFVALINGYQFVNYFINLS